MINPLNANDRAQLRRAVRHWRVLSREARNERRELTTVYLDRPHINNVHFDQHRKAMVNLVQLSVAAQVVALAWRGPTYSVTGRRFGQAGLQFGRRVQAFLNSYTKLIGLPSTAKQIAVDISFGWAVTKTGFGPAPKGVYGIPLAPRSWRVDPLQFVFDGTAPSFEQAMYLGDIYLMPLDEARRSPYFDPVLAAQLQPWAGYQSHEPLDYDYRQAFAQDLTRLVDIYLPAEGVVCTWPALSDEFPNMADRPLSIRETPFNPYDVLSTLDSPTTLIEVAQLSAVKELNYLANDMAEKLARQARQGKRNVVYELGSVHDADTLGTAVEGQPIGLTDLSKMNIFEYPGPNAATAGVMDKATAMYKEQAGNLDVALGLAQTADTARQAQLQAERVGAREAVTVQKFEDLMSRIGEKLASLAFSQEALELEIREPVPGLPQYTIDFSWGPQFPRVGTINDYNFDVVAYSMAYRSPEQRLAQLERATARFAQIMGLASQGAPINIGAVLDTFAKYEDLPELLEWWNGAEPEVGRAAQGGINEGSDIRYQGGMSPGSGQIPPIDFGEPSGGMLLPMGVAA